MKIRRIRLRENVPEPRPITTKPTPRPVTGKTKVVKDPVYGVLIYVRESDDPLHVRQLIALRHAEALGQIKTQDDVVEVMVGAKRGIRVKSRRRKDVKK